MILREEPPLREILGPKPDGRGGGLRGLAVGLALGLAAGLAVAQAVADRVSGRRHIHHGRQALQAVMARLVEDIAEAGYACRFAREISHQAGGAAAENARDGIQFLTAAALQVVARHHKIPGAGEHGPGEQQRIFPIPEAAVAGRFRQRL